MTVSTNVDDTRKQDDLTLRHPILSALLLSLGVAISLGMARFAYGLLLPSMRDSLQWSYTLAGSLNTANAAGYFAGALLVPPLMQRYSAQLALMGGSLLTAVFMALNGLFTGEAMLMLLRALTGASSALVFVSGGLLTARLGTLHTARSGLLLGLYYGGAGLGIVMSALGVPFALQSIAVPSWLRFDWQSAWLLLAALSLLLTLLMWPVARQLDGRANPVDRSERVSPAALRMGLLGYLMFGIGYIGYMTFIIALLKNLGMGGQQITLFYSLLGFACMLSPRIWSGLLDRFKGGETLAILNATLAIATLIPALTHSHVALFLSGLLFGSVFLQVVAATTSLVKHNLPGGQWAAGISYFTTTFAIGQVLGPLATGYISDAGGGLEGGLIFSAATLALGSVLASRQKPLASAAARS